MAKIDEGANDVTATQDESQSKGGGKDRRPYIDKDSNTVIPLSDEAVDILKRRLQRFKDKFAREPGPHDPVFFDPDCDTPAAIDPEQYKASIIDTMRKAGIREALIYAYEQTGMMVTKQNKHLWSEEDMAEWNGAWEEYERARHLERGVKFRRPGPYRTK
jgi:hypothetical protein